MANGDEGFPDVADNEYMSLEIMELKQLLLDLTAKYKYSEDNRKILVKRNALLIADNKALHAKLLSSERRRILTEADLEHIQQRMKCNNIAQKLNEIGDECQKNNNTKSLVNSGTSCGDLLARVKLEELQHDIFEGMEEARNVKYEIIHIEGLTEKEEEEVEENLDNDNEENVRENSENEMNRNFNKSEVLEEFEGAEQNNVRINRDEESQKQIDKERHLKRQKLKKNETTTETSKYEMKEEQARQKLHKLLLEIQNLKNFSSFSSHELENKRQELKYKNLELEDAKRQIIRLQNLVSRLTVQRNGLAKANQKISLDKLISEKSQKKIQKNLEKKKQ